MTFARKDDFYKFIGHNISELAREIAYCFDEMPVVDADRKRFIGIGNANGWDVDVYFNLEDGTINDICAVYAW